MTCLFDFKDSTIILTALKTSIEKGGEDLLFDNIIVLMGPSLISFIRN